MNALILVDIQNDFLPGGALPVPEGDRILPLANRLQAAFPLVVATQDWHPPGHGSFAAAYPGKKPGDLGQLAGLPQMLWPVHCVQYGRGAEFAPGLDTARVAQVFQKGVDPEIDSYSGFFDNGHRRATGLGDYLHERGVTHVFIAGLATDYCVKFTALDARRLGFAVTVIADACRGVNLRPGDAAAALDEVRAAGGRIVPAAEIAGKEACA